MLGAVVVWLLAHPEEGEAATDPLVYTNTTLAWIGFDAVILKGITIGHGT